MAKSRFERERLHPRLNEVITAHLRLCGRRQAVPVMIQNLSAGGAAVLANCRLPVHSTVEELRFALPPIRQQRGVLIAVSAIVRWVAEHRCATHGPYFLHGVEFLDLAQSALTRVRNYVYYRLIEVPDVATPPSPVGGGFGRPDRRLTQSLPS